MNEVFLTVKNAHSDDCGSPPQFEAGPGGSYTSYFENQYGEQWVVQWHTDLDYASLCGGDLGWNRCQLLPLPPKATNTDGVDQVSAHLHKNLKIALNPPERHWLIGCMLAIAFRRHA